MKIFVYTLSILVLLMIIGAVTEQILRWQQIKDLKIGQTFVDVGDYRLQYKKEGKGNCTVVFESGLGSDLGIWSEIQDSVSRNAVTISYNRAGVGLSGSGENPVTNASVNHDLLALLEKTKCPKPYIMVAHSMGGIYLRNFVGTHKEDVAGVVFVDAAHPLQMKMSSPALLKSVGVPPVWLIKLMMNTGLYRLIFSFTSFPPEVPADHPINIQQKKFFYLSFDATMKEAGNDRLNFEDAEKSASFGHIPFAVITGTSAIRTKGFQDESIKKEYQDLVAWLQADFLKLSTDSWLVKAEKSGHIIQASEPGVVIYQIRKVLAKRNGSEQGDH